MVLGKLFGGSNKTQGGGDEEKGTKLEPFELYPPRSPKGLNPKEVGTFGKRLKAFRKAHMSQDDARSNGSLQFLDLETVALRFGKRWLAIREKAFKHIESSIAKRLGADDLYICEDEKRVLLLMTGVDRSEAELRGMRIASEITERLCGVIPGGVAVRFKTVLFDFDLGLDGVTGLTELQSRIRSFNQNADTAEEKLFHDSLSDLRMLYFPTLDTQSGRIYMYHGCPKLSDDQGNLLPVDSVCPQSVNGVFGAEVDKWCLEKAMAHLDSHSNESPMIIVPIRYETLATMRLRDPYLAVCRKLPTVSAEQLVFEILGVPASMPQARIRELVAYVRPFCNHLIARISHKVLFADNFTNCSVSSLSVQLDELNEDDPATQQLLTDIKAVASPLSMRVLLTDTWSVKLCQMAFKAGIHQFNGTAFMKAADRPGPVIETKPAMTKETVKT